MNAASTHEADFSPPTFPTSSSPHHSQLQQARLRASWSSTLSSEAAKPAIQQPHLKFPTPTLQAQFSSMQRPPALWNHSEQIAACDELPPPYGIGHAVHKEITTRVEFAIDTLCSPYSAITASKVKELGLETRPQRIVTSLAHLSAPPVESLLMTTCEVIIHWNGKRRTFFIDAMIWDSLPCGQDMIISNPDAIDTGLIAFALPHEWRRSWLGTAAFSGRLPLALRNDRSIAAALHSEFVMKPEDEDLIDISQRVALTKAHIITDIASLTTVQQYWLKQFPSLNETIPETAHPDLPKFNPPFNQEQMDQYADKPPSKIPRCSPKLQEHINAAFKNLSDARICDLHANPVGVASYVVLVPKPDGSLRICINFSRVNKMLYRHHYPLPPCADLINQIAKHKFYAKIDLYNGFYNFDVDVEAQWLTSTVAPGHALTWRKIPQGLAPVPSWFQWAMTTVLHGLHGVICLLYIDDLIIFGDSPEELNDNIRKILERLDKYHFRIAIKKCDFEPTQEIEFLGHHISFNKIRPGSKSSSILKDIVNPNDEKHSKDKAAKLHTFIGIVNWFSKYIPDCQRQLKPLLDVRLDIDKWEWGEKQQTCFEFFRELLANLQPLHLPTGSDNRLEIHTDASDHGWFAVLFEDTGTGPPQERLKVIAYAGGVFRKNQLSWSTLQKEMFAVYQAHLKFDPFIRLHEFRLCVDNKTMTFCETSADAMVQRWYLRIQGYMSEIVHIPGILNVVPDAGSRLLHLNHPNVTDAQFMSIASSFCSMLGSGPVKTLRDTSELSAALASRALTDSLRHFRQDDDIRAEDAIDDCSIRRLQTRHPAHMHGCLGDAPTSSSHSAGDLGSLSSPHDSAASAATLVSTATSMSPDATAQRRQDDWMTRPMPRGPDSASTVTLPPSLSSSQWLAENFGDAASSTHVQALDAVSVSASACARLAAEPSSARRPLAIAPEHVHLIRTCHGGACGHHGRDETILKLQRAGHTWPTRFIDVARFIASCPTCQRYRLKRKVPYAMYKTILRNAPLFGRWHMDFMTVSQQPCSFTGAKKILVMEEERSRYVMLHCVKDETAIEVVIAMLVTFSIFGIPEYVYSDNAPNIVKSSVEEFIRLTGIRHDFSLPHQAHSNGMVERTCGDTSRLLRMLCSDLHAYGKWSLLVPLVQRMLNSLTRSTIGCSANQLVFGNRVNLDRFILPTAPQQHSDSTREAIANADTVQNFCDTLFIAQQDLLHKADDIRVKLLNDATRSRPLKRDETLQPGQLVLVPWNDDNRKPSRLFANFMGPYVVVRSNDGKGTVSLAHSIVPTPPHEPSTYISAVCELRLYDDTLAIADYDIPEDRFRQLAYIGRNARPIQSILDYRPVALPEAVPDNHVENFEYLVRFEDSDGLSDTSWLPYFSVHHSFAFQSFYRCCRFELSGHQCIAMPAAQRLVHQSRASAASQARSRQHRQDAASSAFDSDAMQFRDSSNA